jgi:hypothetical protein
LNDGGIGLTAGTKGTEEERAGNDRKKNRSRKDGIFPCGVRNEGDALFRSELVIFAIVGGLADDAAGHGPLIHTEMKNHPHMHGNHGEQNAGNHENVEDEEARKSLAADDGSAEHQVDERTADPWDAADDGSADAEAPIGVLIESENLAGEGHTEREKQKEDADDPGQLARIFVCAEEEDLHHVDEDDGDHEVRAPTVNGAQKPAEVDAVIEELQACPGFAGRCGVDERKKNAGDDLQHEQHGCG